MTSGAVRVQRGFAVLVISLFLALYVVVNLYRPLPLWVAGLYLVASALCFVAYAIDKSAARAGRRRISERTLLLLGLAGGWPGAIVAQQALRHKTQKVSFRSAFRGTVVLNLSVFIMLGSPLLAGVLSRFGL
ncbi:MAG: DUF1294 domain-containing protein [Cryobacterium sp.]